MNGSKAARNRLPGLWRHRDYMLVWAGQTVSALGSSVSGLAFPLLILGLTHSPAQAGIAGALRALPYVFLSLPAGALVDRMNLKAVMICCDAGRVAALASVPATIWTGHLSVINLYVATAVEGTLFVFYNIASFAALPYLVPQRYLPAATAQNEASYYASAGLLGSTLGGALYQLGRALPFVLDALSYCASVASLFIVRTRLRRAVEVDTRHHLVVEIGDGLRWMWHQPVIRAMSALYGGDALVSPGLPLTLIVLAQHKHASPSAIGLIFSIAGVGGIAGAAIAGRVPNYLSFGQTMAGARWVMAGFWALYLVAPNPLALGMITAGIFFLNPVSNVVGISYSIPLTPETMRGRIASVFQLIPSAAAPLGLALTGFVLQTVGATATVLIAFAYLSVLAAGITLSASVRHAPPLPS